MFESVRESTAPRDKVCFINGTLDLQSRKLLEHKPDYFFTSQLPFEWQPYAPDPTVVIDWLREATISCRMSFCTSKHHSPNVTEQTIVETPQGDLVASFFGGTKERIPIAASGYAARRREVTSGQPLKWLPTVCLVPLSAKHVGTGAVSGTRRRLIAVL